MFPVSCTMLAHERSVMSMPGVVEWVMVDGAFVLRDGKRLVVDEMALLNEAQAVTQRVRAHMLAAKPDLPPRRRLRWLDA
jgi:5-methylthioadenosine/S-adenosylhomocysteine deaminase